MTEQDFLTAYYQVKAILNNIFKQFGMNQMFFFQQLILQTYLQDARNDYYTEQATAPGTLTKEEEENTNDQPQSSLDSETAAE